MTIPDPPPLLTTPPPTPSTRAPRRQPPPSQLYRNNLLLLVGYLDFVNSFDFPANVWNQRPPPLFARILMGFGGGIMLLFISVGILDLLRSLSNVRVLRAERTALRASLTSALSFDEARVLQAWLGVNRRELGWEYFDRIGLDVSMSVSGCIVGVGTLLAIRGDKEAVYRASNLMSGYIGNSFMPAFAAVNTSWSAYMFLAARRHHGLLTGTGKGIDTPTLKRLLGHARRHQLYAAMMVCSTWVTSVGSMMSATMWQGYVVLIPSVVGSIWCNWFWRQELGYDRRVYHDWISETDGGFDVLEQFRLAAKTAREDRAHAERFLAELYGFWLAAASPAEAEEVEMKVQDTREMVETGGQSELGHPETPPDAAKTPRASIER